MKYFELLLDDAAQPSFVSFSKPYYGTPDDLQIFFSKFPENKLIQSVACAFSNAQQGLQTDITYPDIPAPTPVTVLAKKSFVSQSLNWEHENIWGSFYLLRCESAKTTHIWLHTRNSYVRCLQVSFTGLEYASKRTPNHWKPVFNSWGYPHIIEFHNSIVSNRLFVTEKYFENLELAKIDIESFAGQADFTEFCNDIFGDG